MSSGAERRYNVYEVKFPGHVLKILKYFERFTLHHRDLISPGHIWSSCHRLASFENEKIDRDRNRSTATGEEAFRAKLGVLDSEPIIPLMNLLMFNEY